MARLLLGVFLFSVLAIFVHADGLTDPSMQLSDPACGTGEGQVPCAPVSGTTFTFTTTTGEGIFGFTNANTETTFSSIFLQETGISAALISCDTGPGGTDPNTGNAYIFNSCQAFDNPTTGFTGIYFSNVFLETFDAAFTSGIVPGENFFFDLNRCPNCSPAVNDIWLVPQTFYGTANLSLQEALAAPAPVPEPASLVLAGSGIAAFLSRRLLKRG